MMMGSRKDSDTLGQLSKLAEFFGAPDKVLTQVAELKTQLEMLHVLKGELEVERSSLLHDKANFEAASAEAEDRFFAREHDVSAREDALAAREQAVADGEAHLVENSAKQKASLKRLVEDHNKNVAAVQDNLAKLAAEVTVSAAVQAKSKQDHEKKVKETLADHADREIKIKNQENYLQDWEDKLSVIAKEYVNRIDNLRKLVG